MCEGYLGDYTQQTFEYNNPNIILKNINKNSVRCSNVDCNAQFVSSEQNKNQMIAHCLLCDIYIICGDPPCNETKKKKKKKKKFSPKPKDKQSPKAKAKKSIVDTNTSIQYPTEKQFPKAKKKKSKHTQKHTNNDLNDLNDWNDLNEFNDFDELNEFEFLCDQMTKNTSENESKVEYESENESENETKSETNRGWRKQYLKGIKTKTVECPLTEEYLKDTHLEYSDNIKEITTVEYMIKYQPLVNLLHNSYHTYFEDVKINSELATLCISGVFPSNIQPVLFNKQCRDLPYIKDDGCFVHTEESMYILKIVEQIRAMKEKDGEAPDTVYDPSGDHSGVIHFLQLFQFDLALEYIFTKFKNHKVFTMIQNAHFSQNKGNTHIIDAGVLWVDQKNHKEPMHVDFCTEHELKGVIYIYIFDL